ncbi:hypothetical protein GALL_437900 [mine drainage metagenome]|uniref:Uncharacterized protein n=1 Tax=mine drainage metagenome TaxID=410659 RepID=A0A1J5PST7_9ZZZZ
MTATAIAPASNTAPPTRYNAVRHGLLSQYAVLPWESRDEYEALLLELTEEHGPVGPTETHFVEELAGIFWRKRRLRIAEAATYRGELHGEATRYGREEALTGAALMPVTGKIKSKASVPAAMASTSADTAKELRELRRDKALTEKAWDFLEAAKPEAYEQALTALRDDTRAYWLECLAEPGTHRKPTAEALRSWIDAHWREWFEDPIAELEHRDAIREQAFGVAYASGKLEGLARYETHLDRKLERTLSALFRLRELRNTGEGKAS